MGNNIKIVKKALNLFHHTDFSNHESYYCANTHLALFLSVLSAHICLSMTLCLSKVLKFFLTHQFSDSTIVSRISIINTGMFNIVL